MIRAVIVFLCVYIGLVLIHGRRWLVTWAGGAVALLLGALAPREIIGSINWNVLAIFAGTLILAELFIISKVPEAIADMLINRSANLGLAFLSIIAFTSLLSAFIENVAAVLIVAPVALQLARKAKVSPVPVIIGLAITSNLQGTSTLIGDPPSMILAAAVKLNFMDFILYRMRDGSGALKPGIFWFVQLGAIVSIGVLFYFFRGMKRKPDRIPVTPIVSLVPSFLLGLMISLLVLASFIDPGFVWFGGTSCLAVSLMGLIWQGIRDKEHVKRTVKGYDWQTTLFLAGVFVLVGMLENRGAIEAFLGQLVSLRGMHPFVLYTVIVWVSVLLSAFIDNVPYVTAMLPVVITFASDAAMPVEPLAFGLLIGACLGGNITPIGASANIVATGLLRREGRPVSFGQFVKMGLPFTIVAVGAAYVALWLVYR
jgi:Na+/H+ antiporter NhaD/arsenite permease-like protein